MKRWRIGAAIFFICLSPLLMQGCGGGGGGGDPKPPPTITDINGALQGSGTIGSLFLIEGTDFSNLSGQRSGFSVDFRDSTSNQVVATAQVDYAAGGWTDTLIKGIVPNGLNPGTIYTVTVSTTSGTTSPVNFLVVASVAFSPSTITWSSTYSLSQAQQGFPTVIAPIFSSPTDATNYIYTLGGNTSTVAADDLSANVSVVAFNQMDNSTGALVNATWTEATPLPEPRGFAAGILANSFNSLASGNGTIYVFGGLDGSGIATDTVYFASVADDGTIPASNQPGTWATTTPLPQPLFAEAAVIFHGRIYVAGGNDASGTPVAKVYSAKVNDDGSLGDWQTLPDLPVALAYHRMVTAGGFLYVLGGDSAAVDPISNILPATVQDATYSSQINLVNGNLSAWTASSNMGKAREKFSAVAAGNAVVVTGGLYGGSPGSSESRYATINTDGTLTNFSGATGTNTISSLSGGTFNPYNHSSAYFVDSQGNPHILILGGADATSGSPAADVWFQH